jgi:zinc protease
MSGQASRLGVAEVVVGDLDHSRTYFAQLEAVDARRLSRVTARYLVPERLTAVSSSPRAAAAPLAPVQGAAAGERADFSEVRLPNGARILLQPDRRLPNLHLRLMLQGGALYEEAGKRGATMLLATMLTKDTRRRPAAMVAGYIEEVGGSFFPFSGNNSLGVAVEVLPPDVDRAVSVLTEALMAPAFRAATLETEREAQIAALQQDDDDVVTLARKRLRERFFGCHPLSLDAAGNREGVAALTAKDLQGLHRRLAVGPNVVLVVAGDFEPRRLLPALKRVVQGLPAGPAPVWAVDVAGLLLPATPGDHVETQPREQAVVLQGFPGPSINADDFYVGEVIDELFSGMASRLFERVREEKGLAYFVRSGRVTGIESGMFYFVAGTQPGREQEVLAEIDAEVSRVATGAVEAAELARCQTRLKAARRQSLQTNSARAMQAGLNALQGQPINDWKNYDGRVESVTIADLAAFAQRRLVRERRTQLVVRP